MRRESPRRAAENRAYRKQRVEFLTENPLCQMPKWRDAKCNEPATEVHHRRGRVGALLLDQRYWSAMCSRHHRYVTEHPAHAYSLGISERRIGGAA